VSGLPWRPPEAASAAASWGRRRRRRRGSGSGRKPRRRWRTTPAPCLRPSWRCAGPGTAASPPSPASCSTPSSKGEPCRAQAFQLPPKFISGVSRYITLCRPNSSSSGEGGFSCSCLKSLAILSSCQMCSVCGYYCTAAAANGLLCSLVPSCLFYEEFCITLGLY
jgi:hypothetical protein